MPSRPAPARRLAALLALLLVLLPGLATGCNRSQFWAPRAWLAEPGGVLLGTPWRDESGDVFLPLSLQPARGHTRRTIHSVELDVQGERIVLRVRVSVPGPRFSGRPGGPEALGDIVAGRYTAFYRQRDGSLVRLAQVQVP